MFSIGNLVTLLVVVAMLFMYRRLDLKNRSLEKVKRYADNAAKRVANAVDQKVMEVHDLAIELQVNLKTGTELLKRVRGVEEGLSARAEEMEQLERGLSDHDATLTQLAVRTDSVAANLRPVEAASAGVATLKAHLGEVRGMTASLETRLQGLGAAVTDLDERIDGLLNHRQELQAVHHELGQARELGVAVAEQVKQLQGQRGHLATLENSIRGLELNLTALQPRVGEVSEIVARQQQQLEAFVEGSDRAEQALAALGRIDGTMTDLEHRAERLQVAREWLARTETRLAEIGSGAQEQLRLLETLLKADSGDNATRNGSAALGKRETVLKLAEQGWSVPEIARATKLSRGEVELTLEVSATSITP